MTELPPRPDNIPKAPQSVYKTDWKGFPDWLGYERKKKIYRISYEKAKEIVHEADINSASEYFRWTKGELKRKKVDFPDFLPKHPQESFKNKGWISWGDFLSTGRVATRLIKYKSFKEVKKFALSLKLNSYREWREHLNNNKVPPEIPRYPDDIYRGKGWKSWPDFLGYELKHKKK